MSQHLNEASFARLPKYAQEHIRRIEAQRDDYKAKAFAVMENQPTRVQIEPYRGRGYAEGLAPTYVPDRSTVRFVLSAEVADTRLYIDADLCRRPSGRLYLRLMGGDGLVLNPSSSNVIELEVER